MKSWREAERTMIGSDSGSSSVEEVSLEVGSRGRERENGSREEAVLGGRGEFCRSDEV